MERIAIYGAGGLGREISQMISQINGSSPKWEMIGFYDDYIPKGTVVKGFEVLGGISELNKQFDELNLVIGIADNILRRQIAEKITNVKIIYPTLIHPSVIMEKSEVSLGQGSIITAGNILTTDIKIGKHCIINLGCTIGHDLVLDDFCVIMPGVHLSGNISMGQEVFVGTGARILQNLTIGRRSKIGAGAVVIREVSDGDTVVGVPAKSKKKP
jgi:sugar O-acyltransferase (sialic acid O-acetyltransferase NeuD family)